MAADSSDQDHSISAGRHSQKPDPPAVKQAVLFDFRRPDRIAKAQLRAIHLLHDTFVRNLVASLSAYLRSYVTVNLVSVEQLSYSDFLKCLPSPSCIASMSLAPYDGNAVLEINSSIIFPILEMLLGGTGKTNMPPHREITEIEQNLLEGLFRIILRDLRESWSGITNIDFQIESLETEPQFLQILAPTEAVVAIAIEVRLGSCIGMMNLAMPSIIIKMMRQKFHQQWSVRKTESSTAEQSRIRDLMQSAEITLEARLDGPTLLLEDLMNLENGDVLCFDYPVNTPLGCNLNGRPKLRGHIVSSGQKIGFQLVEPCLEKPGASQGDSTQ